MEEIFYTDLLALVEQDGFKAVRTSTSRGGQHNGPCPFCQKGHDRFRVQPHHGPYGWYACSQCGRKGTAINYLIDMRGFSKQEALQAVGWKPKDGSEPRFLLPASAQDARPQWDEPPERWQRAAKDFIHACQEILWSDAGRAALSYLRGRGLKDGTIRYAMLGYHPQEEYGAAQVWGRPKAVKLRQGIVIPWLYQGAIWRITIRDERIASGNGRYRQVSGGSNGLYLADSLTLKRPCVVVTEGEFDALSVAQECGRHVAVVATGTTQGSHTPRWIGLLECQPCALIAFDGEEKGDTAANWWLTRLSNAQRLRPLWGDANQMLQEGADLHEWMKKGRSAPLSVPRPEARLVDIQTARSETPEPEKPSAAIPALVHLTQVRTFLPVLDNLREACQQAPGPMALDLETTGLDPRRHKVVSIALGAPGKVSVLDMRPYYNLSPEHQRDWQQAIHRLLHIPAMVWIGQNLKFDWQFLAIHFGARLGERCELYDIMLAEQAIQMAVSGKGHAPVALRDTAARYQIPVSKEERIWFEKLDERPQEWAAPFPEEQLRYIVQDIEVPSQIAQLQQPLLQHHQLEVVAQLENDCLSAIASMEMRGALVDREQWLSVLEKKQARRTALEQDLITALGSALQSSHRLQAEKMQAYQQALRIEETRLMHLYTSDEQARRSQPWEAFRACGLAHWKQKHPEPHKPSAVSKEQAINLGSSAQVKEALAQLGIHVSSTREEALEEYAAKNPLIARFLAWRKLDHFCSAFGESLLAHVQPDGRIHAHFAQIGAISGRIICSRPNLQQIPKKREQEAEEEDIRRCFIAPPGSQLIKSDLSNIELRILAEVSRDATMLRFFAEGKDLHAETAKLMFRLPADTDTKKHLHQGMTVREIAKTINYGLSYGMSAFSLSQRINVPVDEARELMRSYFHTYAGIDRWLRQAGPRVRKQGYVTSLAGRKRAFTFEGADRSQQAGFERMARNHPIQATNADILKRALSILFDVLPDGAHLILAVHDEIVLECPEPLIEDVTGLLKEALIEACRTYLKVVHIPEPEVLIASYWQKG